MAVLNWRVAAAMASSMSLLVRLVGLGGMWTKG